jgi:hypothetical protein
MVIRGGGFGVNTHWAEADAGPVEIASTAGTVSTAAARAVRRRDWCMSGDTSLSKGRI